MPQIETWVYVPIFFCRSSPDLLVNLTSQNPSSLLDVCAEIVAVESFDEYISENEDKYNEPMVLIGFYISIASLFCVLAMALDLLYGFRNGKFWFPSKCFSLNAASITVIAVAMKLLLDLSSSMGRVIDQVAKVGSLTFMCTMMSNLMPSLAYMGNKSLIANVIGLSIFIITLIVNICIQLSTHVINSNDFHPFHKPSYMVVATYIYISMLLFLLMILISFAITIPTSKEILELKYQAMSKTTMNNQHQQENLISLSEKLTRLVKRRWIMVETGNPQFVMASNPLSSASGVICAISMVIYIYMVRQLMLYGDFLAYSVYKKSTTFIVVTQSIGIVVGSIAPILRCFTVLSFKSFANQNWKHFMGFEEEKYWTQKLCEWKERRISVLSSGCRSSVLLHNLKNHILSFCIGFQKSMRVKLITRSTASSNEETNEDLSSFVMLLDDNMRLTQKTMKEILDSMNRLIQCAAKKQHKNLLMLLETYVTFEGVETFDTDQVPSLLCVELVNGWSLPIIILTCIVVAIPGISKDKGNHELWHEVEDKCKWLETTLESSAYEGKTPTDIIKSFAYKAEEIVNEFNTSNHRKFVEKENLPPKVIIANSMYRISQTIIHTYESNNLEITENELFTRLSGMIADILVACLINIPRVITMRCHESTIEKREASVLAAIDLLGHTTKIIKRLETRELPNMDPDKMGFIDDWRLHLKQP
ncbi:uncharacterized protein LOC110944487 [Helianthus annuus]|uniref:uncharacterized protein LOC110944487 n=1 Tax=Helianthus annuus TaxID=4232 RepID=UPI000B8F632B|nr:uncharacterized protein LOC110944487 [Helianthus annuus]